MRTQTEPTQESRSRLGKQAAIKSEEHEGANEVGQNPAVVIGLPGRAVLSLKLFPWIAVPSEIQKSTAEQKPLCPDFSSQTPPESPAPFAPVHSMVSGRIPDHRQRSYPRSTRILLEAQA